MSNASSEEDRRILQEMFGRSGSPAFIRRAKLVEDAWEELLARCRKARGERLVFVRLRLGQLHALAGGWDLLKSFVPLDQELAALQDLFAELQPRLLLPLEPTTSTRVMRSAAIELGEAIAMFNDRWRRWLARVDLKPINGVREDYNRYYLFEKECAVGSARVARIGYSKLEPITLATLENHFPPLACPQFQWE